MILGFRDMGELQLLAKLQELYNCLKDPECKKKSDELRACCLNSQTPLTSCRCMGEVSQKRGIYSKATSLTSLDNCQVCNLSMLQKVFDEVHNKLLVDKLLVAGAALLLSNCFMRTLLII